MAAGYPGTFPGGLTTGYIIIGAVQKQVSGAAGYPGVFPGGLTTGYITIGAVQKNVAAGGTLYERTAVDGIGISDAPRKQENHLAFESVLFSDTQKVSIDKILIDRVFLTDSISKSMSKLLLDMLFLGDSGLAQIISGLVERLLTDKVLLLDYSQKIQEGRLIDGLLLGDQRGAINLTKVLEDRFFITDTIVLQALKVLHDKVLLGDSELRQKALQLLQLDITLIADLRFSQTDKSIQDVIETSEYVIKFAQMLTIDNMLFSDQSTQLLLSSVVEYLISAQLRMINLLSIRVGHNNDYLSTQAGQKDNYLGRQISWNNTEVVWQ